MQFFLKRVYILFWYFFWAEDYILSFGAAQNLKDCIPILFHLWDMGSFEPFKCSEILLHVNVHPFFNTETEANPVACILSNSNIAHVLKLLGTIHCSMNAWTSLQGKVFPPSQNSRELSSGISLLRCRGGRWQRWVVKVEVWVLPLKKGQQVPTPFFLERSPT